MIVKEVPEPVIFDIRHDKAELSLTEMTRSSIRNSEHSLELPTLLLWDEEGLQHFERITYHKDYYLTQDEIALLEKHSDEIAAKIAPNSILLELGSGNLRKVSILLDALERAEKDVSYYALDVSYEELHRTLSMISPGRFQHVQYFGLLGTYDDGFAWAQRPEQAMRPKCVISLGSTIGSYDHEGAAGFLKSLADILGQRSTDASRDIPQPLFVVGLDGCTNGKKVWRAYNDPDGLHKSFISNGLKHANRVLGYEAFEHGKWKVEGRWEEARGGHFQYVVPQKSCIIEGREFRKGELVKAVQSTKFNPAQQRELWETAGLRKICGWTRSGGYGLHLLGAEL